MGTQHHIKSFSNEFLSVYRQFGIRGLWQGVSGAIPRVMVGSGAQLSSFSTAKEFVINKQFFKEDSIMIPICSAMVGSVSVVCFMTPFDVVSTRMYNQALTGQMYENVFDTFAKILRKEGLFGLYKGIGASYFRTGPHTLMSLTLWDTLRRFIESKSLDSL